MAGHASQVIADRAAMLLARFGETSPAVITGGGATMSVEAIFTNPTAVYGAGYQIEVNGRDPVLVMRAVDAENLQRGYAVQVAGKNYEIGDTPVLDAYGALAVVQIVET